MNAKYYMPTRVVAGSGCVRESAALLKRLGSRALVMTGARSARQNGALADVEAALDSQGIGHELFDRVEANPGIGNCREAARAAIEAGAEFVVGIGGGSPLDAAKVAALMARDELPGAEVFGGAYPKGALPVVAVPTTAGTGSEVTQYAILTNDAIESKTSVSSDLIFPALAFLDAKYTATLSARAAASTAMDALSHAVESYLSLRSDELSRAAAREALRLLGRAMPSLAAAAAAAAADEAARWDLLIGSNLAGAAIAQSGTTVVHAMGYSLTYFKGIEHGRANGLLLGAYLEFIEGERPREVREVLDALGWRDSAAFRGVLDSLLGEREGLDEAELEKFSAMAAAAKHALYTARKTGAAEVRRIFEDSMRRSARGGSGGASAARGAGR
jgi:alcohol dehydrogenase class IV